MTITTESFKGENEDSSATDEYAEFLYNDNEPDPDAQFQDIPNGDLGPEEEI